MAPHALSQSCGSETGPQGGNGAGLAEKVEPPLVVGLTSVVALEPSKPMG